MFFELWFSESICPVVGLLGCVVVLRTSSQVVLVPKNQPAKVGDAREKGWEDPLEEGMATHALENPMDREA